MKIFFKLDGREYSVPFNEALFSALGQIKSVSSSGYGATRAVTEAPVEPEFRVVMPSEIAPENERLVRQVIDLERDLDREQTQLRKLRYALAPLSVLIADASDSKLKELLTVEFKKLKDTYASYDSGWKFDEAAKQEPSK